LLPVLDGIDAARAHGELNAGATMLADEVAKVTAKYGLVAYGEAGDPFDPHVHDALMHMDQPGYPVASVAQVFQRGYALGERVIRPARVGVTDADPALAPGVPEPAGGPAEPAEPDPAEAPPDQGEDAGGPAGPAESQHH
jgi:molecular chaperone GrpE